MRLASRPACGFAAPSHALHLIGTILTSFPASVENACVLQSFVLADARENAGKGGRDAHVEVALQHLANARVNAGEGDGECFQSGVLFSNASLLPTAQRGACKSIPAPLAHADCHLKPLQW